MKKKFSCIVGLFLLVLGILTGCESRPGSLGSSEQGVLQGEKATNHSEDAKGSEDIQKEASDSTGEPEDARKETSGSTGEPEEIRKEASNHAGDIKETDPSEGDFQEGLLEEDEREIREDGAYTSKEEVAAYLYQYGRLPDNYITKKDAKALGWVSSEGNLGKVAPGKSIGGDYFGNYEELLPTKQGRRYYECDIDTDGSYRGAKRIVYSNDGLIYYTEDHYTTFELLYTKDGPA